MAWEKTPPSTSGLDSIDNTVTHDRGLGSRGGDGQVPAERVPLTLPLNGGEASLGVGEAGGGGGVDISFYYSLKEVRMETHHPKYCHSLPIPTEPLARRREMGSMEYCAQKEKKKERSDEGKKKN